MREGKGDIALTNSLEFALGILWIHLVVLNSNRPKQLFKAIGGVLCQHPALIAKMMGGRTVGHASPPRTFAQA